MLRNEFKFSLLQTGDFHWEETIALATNTVSAVRNKKADSKNWISLDSFMTPKILSSYFYPFTWSYSWLPVNLDDDVDEQKLMHSATSHRSVGSYGLNIKRYDQKNKKLWLFRFTAEMIYKVWSLTEKTLSSVKLFRSSIYGSNSEIVRRFTLIKIL